MTRAETFERYLSIAFDAATTSLTRAEIGDRHGVCVRTVRRAIRRVELRSIRAGASPRTTLTRKAVARNEHLIEQLALIREETSDPAEKRELIALQSELMAMQVEWEQLLLRLRLWDLSSGHK